MNKKIVIGVLLAFFCSVGLSVLSMYWNIWSCFDRSDILKCENLSIEQIVIESIDIQYKGGDKKELDKIFTSNFIKEIDSNPKFYKKKILYTFNKDFMKTFKKLNENQSSVSVTIEDLSGSYIEIVTLVKDSNGVYLISNIEFDI